MSKAISMHIGLNRVDPAHYGFTGALRGCINDAKAMQKIAQAQNFQTQILLDEQATSITLMRFLDDMANTLVDGDTLLITYAGHGFEVPDLNNDEQPNTVDQTWALFDRMVVDDELAERWDRFAEGVRIIIVSDSCHSETVARSLELTSALMAKASDGVAAVRSAGITAPLIGEKGSRGVKVTGYRTLPREAAARVLSTHADFYASIQQTTRGSEKVNPQLRATVLSLSACLDWQVAADGEPNGLYTRTLLSTWNNGAFTGSYRSFQDSIADSIGNAQRPQFRRHGRIDTAFENERPFSVRNAVAGDPGTIEIGDDDGKGKGNGSVSSEDYCRLELLIAKADLASLTESELSRVLASKGAETLMAAVSSVRSLGDSADAEVRVSRKGSIRCVAVIDTTAS